MKNQTSLPQSPLFVSELLKKQSPAKKSRAQKAGNSIKVVDAQKAYDFIAAHSYETSVKKIGRLCKKVAEMALSLEALVLEPTKIVKKLVRK